MEPEEIKTAVVTFGLLAEAEGTLAELYRTCGRGGDIAFWNGLAAQEDKHAANLTEMARLIAVAKGEHFTMKRRFPAAAVRSFIKYLQDNLARVHSGAKTGSEFYELARTIEQAVLDQRYPDIVESDDASFNELMDRTIKETEAHLRALTEKSRKAQA